MTYYEVIEREKKDGWFRVRENADHIFFARIKADGNFEQKAVPYEATMDISANNTEAKKELFKRAEHHLISSQEYKKVKGASKIAKQHRSQYDALINLFETMGIISEWVEYRLYGKGR